MSSSATPTHATAPRDASLDAQENCAPLNATVVAIGAVGASRDVKMSPSTSVRSNKSRSSNSAQTTPRRVLQPLDTNRGFAVPDRFEVAPAGSSEKSSSVLLKRKHRSSDESPTRPLQQRTYSALSPVFARDSERENLAWLDMLVALLERKYGAHAAPLDIAALEAANASAAASVAAADARTSSDDNSTSVGFSGGGSRRVSGQHALQKELAMKDEPSLRDATEREKERRRQRVLLRHAQQIQDSSVASSTCCGCKTGCLKMCVVTRTL